MPSNEDIEYTDEFISKLQIAFGKGFLSPGGAEEVAKIVEGIDLSAKEVLDIGVGIGGPACLLVTNHGAGKVTGIDVEEPVLREAQATVSSKNLENQIDLQFVTPGPLPFDDATFDVVFSKDSIIHIPDKQSLFSVASCGATCVSRLNAAESATKLTIAAADWPGSATSPSAQRSSRRDAPGITSRSIPSSAEVPRIAL